MKRILTFDGPRAPKRFQLLWTSLIAGGSTNGDSSKDRTPAVIRKEARLQDALESISDAVEAGPNEPDRALKMAGGTLTLTQEDFDLLQQYTEKTPWMPRVSRDVVDLWDFLSACPKHE